MAEWFADAAPPAPAWAPGRVLARAANLALIVAGLRAEGRRGDSTPTVFARRARRTAGRILEAHGVDVRLAGPIPRTPALIVANHVSYLDPLVVSSAVPCLSIAKGETERWPLIGAGLAALGVLFVRRGDAHSGAVTLRRARRTLGAGTSVLNFPEGTTSDGRAVGPFHRGGFGLAGLARVPVVPAHIAYGDDRVPWFGGQTFGPHYARLAALPRVTATLRFGHPLAVDVADDARDVARRAHDAVQALGLSGAGARRP